MSSFLRAFLLWSCVGLVFGQGSVHKELARTGRFEDMIDVDTFGCRTVPLITKAIDTIGKRRSLPAGCFDLNEDQRGLPVFGPLQINNPMPTSHATS